MNVFESRRGDIPQKLPFMLYQLSENTKALLPSSIRLDQRDLDQSTGCGNEYLYSLSV